MARGAVQPPLVSLSIRGRPLILSWLKGGFLWAYAENNMRLLGPGFHREDE